MSLANQKATTEYQEAIQATEDLESPAVGFAKTTDYKGGLTNQVNAVIKQNNTLLYFATKQSQKLVELEEKFDKLKQEIHTIKEREVQPADLEDSISSLAKRLDSFSISGKLPKTKHPQQKFYANTNRTSDSRRPNPWLSTNGPEQTSSGQNNKKSFWKKYRRIRRNELASKAT
ncbi:hypothetical protein Tco_1522769 [Tanacetum coccineum]